MLVERLGLGDCGRTPYRRLSGGQQQRLGLAMAVVGRPELVFVDEPTAGMDPQARRTTWELLEELRADGVTVVLTTHYMDEAERLADQIHIIDHGRLIASGSPLELTRGGGDATIRLVVTEPFPPGAPESLQRGARRRHRGHASSTSSACSSPARPTPPRWPRSRRWCEEHGVLPESLTPRASAPSRTSSSSSPAGSCAVTVEPAPSPRRPARRRCPGRSLAQARWRRG